jgi:hypothetical protein
MEETTPEEKIEESKNPEEEVQNSYLLEYLELNIFLNYLGFGGDDRTEWQRGGGN